MVVKKDKNAIPASHHIHCGLPVDDDDDLNVIAASPPDTLWLT